ncbi:MAG: SpoIIE family protein phosphatase [Clostridia bacterium]|nr:SpoIIE family protein phosphatase [Clostridia bacterium]
MNPYLKLGLLGMLPAIAAGILYTVDRKTKFEKIDKRLKQVIFGVIFGMLAIVGTEFGIPINGAQINARDAAVIVAGLFFGSPAGIIAGFIGGIERWFAVAWGVGEYTRIACSVSTILAGFYAALVNKFILEHKRPEGLMSFVLGVIMEVFHLLMVLFTHMSNPEDAMRVIIACAMPMITINGISLFVASATITILSFRHNKGSDRKPRISQIVQRWLVLTLVIAFVATTLFIANVQDQMAVGEQDTLLETALEEIKLDIKDSSNANILRLSDTIAEDIKVMDIRTVARKYGIAEINIVNKKGIISASTNPDFIGYEMSSGKQSSEFLVLLGDTQSYVQDYGPISYDATISRKYAGVKLEEGFVQIGYDAANFQHDIDKFVQDVSKNRHVGKSGYVLVIDSEYNIVSSPKEITIDSVKEVVNSIELPGENVTFSTVFNGESCRIRYSAVEGYNVISVLPESEANFSKDVSVYINTFMLVMVFAIMFGLIYRLIKVIVVDKIVNVNKSLDVISSGDLNEVVNERTSKEFNMLSNGINHTVDVLKDYIDKAQKKIEAELELAKNIQSSALPSNFPAFPRRKDVDVFALMNPAKEVGGDFYDFYLTDDDTLNILVADVSGKGIPAAMFMMRAKTELKTLTESGAPLSDVFTRGNAALCEGNDAGMFVTALQGSIDLSTGYAQFANAGHNPPLIKHPNGKFEYLKLKSGFILAGMDGMKYKTQELNLEPGDILFMYTDGVTEATNANNELYGEDRLRETINSKEFETVEEMCKFIRADIDVFVGDAPQFDDITMVAFKYIGKPIIPTIHYDEASIEDITTITEFVENELEKIECPLKIVTSINIAIDELYSNIVKYGYGDKKGPATVKVDYDSFTKVVSVIFIDEGIPYNPLMKADPDVTLSAEERKIGGLGIYMVKKTMDNIKYRYENDQNILTIQKKIGG